MICQLCKKDKKLIESHIIPRSFYKPLKNNNEIPMLVTDKMGFYPKRTPIGVYDKEIVCEECERIFGSWDNYGNDFFKQKLLQKNFIVHNNKNTAYNFGKCDYKKLKLFFLSLLWRASVSKQPMFSRVNLGKYEDKIKELMLTKLDEDDKDFSIAIFKFVDKHVSGFLDPDRTKFKTVNHYRLYFDEYMAIIKVSNLPNPSYLKNIYIEENKDVICILRDFQKSKEYNVMKMTVRKSHYNSNKKLHPRE